LEETFEEILLEEYVEEESDFFFELEELVEVVLRVVSDE